MIPKRAFTLLKIGKREIIYTGRGKIAHELDHVLREVRYPGMFAIEAGYTGSKYSFKEVYNIERSAYLTQHGANIIGMYMTIPEAASLNAGMATRLIPY